MSDLCVLCNRRVTAEQHALTAMYVQGGVIENVEQATPVTNTIQYSKKK